MLEDKNQKPVSELDQLGEFGLIDHLTSNIKLQNTSSKKGVGDDAAVVLLSSLSQTLCPAKRPD